MISRFYNPISRIDDKGFVDFMIKTIKKGENAPLDSLNMPSLLANMQVLAKLIKGLLFKLFHPNNPN